MEDDFKKKLNGRRPKKKFKNGRRPKIFLKMEENFKKNGRQPQKKRKKNQSTKNNLIGCDTIEIQTMSNS
jgi:hypothetical protein